MSFTEKNGDVLENKTVTQDHSLEAEDGTKLREKKVVTTYCKEGSSQPLRTEKVHARWIGGRVYTVTEVDVGQGNEPLRAVTTSLADDEVHAFQDEWALKWRPMVDETTVAKAQEQPVHAGALFAHDGGIQGELPIEVKEAAPTDEQKPEADQTNDVGSQGEKHVEVQQEIAPTEEEKTEVDQTNDDQDTMEF